MDARTHLISYGRWFLVSLVSLQVAVVDLLQQPNLPFLWSMTALFSVDSVVGGDDAAAWDHEQVGL